MRFRTLLFAIAHLAAVEAESGDLTKVASVNDGDLFASVSDSEETREWTPYGEWIIPQKELIAIAKNLLQDKLKPHNEPPEIELTHLVWTRSFEGWWFLQVQFLITPSNAASVRGENLESVFLLPNGRALQLK